MTLVREASFSRAKLIPSIHQNGSIKVDLGSTGLCLPSYIRVGNTPESDPDIFWNLECGLPKRESLYFGHEYLFPNDSVNEFRAYHSLERIRNLILLMDETWNATVHNGILKVYAPSVNFPQWDISIRVFSKEMFESFTKPSSLTEKTWTILDGYPKIVSTEIECWMTPNK